jgi:hypothetical protein
MKEGNVFRQWDFTFLLPFSLLSSGLGLTGAKVL